jgi:two-component system response regulator BaeR
MTEQILIVEDEQKLAELLRDYLLQAGYEPFILSEGTAVVEWVREHGPDLILLDLMLPGRNGLDICKDIRAFSTVPVIMTTARVEEIDRLLGLELGADDYICKPYSPRELVARVKAVLRRSSGRQLMQSPELILHEDRYQAVLNGHLLDLTAVEFKLLQYLAATPGRILGRQQLMDHIYPDNRVVADRTIDSHIKKLRKKLTTALPEQELIHSMYGVGYTYDPGR